MTILLILIGVLLLFIPGSLLLVWFLLSQTRSLTPGKNKEIHTSGPRPFYWKAVILPLVIFGLTACMVAWFYGRLPAEVGWNFDSDGSPGTWTARGTLIAWTLLSQFLLALLAISITWIMGRISSFINLVEETGINPESLLLVMGNMIALPQLILAFAMLDAFSYNAYDVHILQLWIITLIVAFIGMIILGAFFITAVRKIWLKNK